jgi:hypothetical protein
LGVLPERLWRVRKDSRTMEALLRGAPDEDAGGVEIRILYNGEVMHERRWTSRALAVDAAARTLHELLLAGWATHW